MNRLFLAVLIMGILSLTYVTDVRAEGTGSAGFCRIDCDVETRNRIMAPVTGCITARDILGRDVIFDEKGEALNVGPVVFSLDPGALQAGESYVYDDGSTYNPVEDNKYIMYPSGDKGKVLFLKKTSKDELIKISGGEYTVDFRDEINEKASCSIRRHNEGFTLAVSPVRGAHVFCEIKGPKNGVLDEITEDTTFTLKGSGRYRIRVYAEDGMGKRRYADIPSIFMVQ